METDAKTFARTKLPAFFINTIDKRERHREKELGFRSRFRAHLPSPQIYYASGRILRYVPHRSDDRLQRRRPHDLARLGIYNRKHQSNSF